VRKVAVAKQNRWFPQTLRTTRQSSRYMSAFLSPDLATWHCKLPIRSKALLSPLLKFASQISWCTNLIYKKLLMSSRK